MFPFPNVRLTESVLGDDYTTTSGNWNDLAISASASSNSQENHHHILTHADSNYFIMNLTNNFTGGTVFWRIFDTTETVYGFGRSDGVLAIGESPGPINHPDGHFKIEFKRDGLFGVFLIRAGEVFSNDDNLLLTADGQLERILSPGLPPPSRSPAILLRVMAWNIRIGVGSIIDDTIVDDHFENSGIPKIAEVIKVQTPDIVLLNEAAFWRFPTGIGFNQVSQLAELTGMPYFQYEECNWMGLRGMKLVGVLSRFPLGQKSKIVTVVEGKGDIGYSTLKTSIVIAGKVHHLYSIRFNSHSGSENLLGATNAVSSLRTLPPSDAVIFGGDFNSKTGGDNPSFDFFVQTSGLTNAASNNEIDHIFFRGLFLKQGQNVIPACNPSDHGYVFAEFASQPEPFHAAYGDVIKIKHSTSGNILHSHPHNYGHPQSSGQQQVTAYAGADDNDYWLVKGPHTSANDYKRGVPVQHNDIIRLEHVNTRQNLHSHSGCPSPVAKHQEVTCYGTDGFGDDNDNWRIEIEGGGIWTSGKQARLVHVNTNRQLNSKGLYRSRKWEYSHPQWTMGQQEATAYVDDEHGPDDLWHLFELR